MYLVYLLLGLVLVQYQNCAPSNENLDSPTIAASAPGVIDQISVGEISFAQSKVPAFMDQNVIIFGVCDQTGSLISWTLSDQNGDFIERGLSECDRGSFEVNLSDQWKNFCNETLSLKAALGTKASSETLVEANCQ